MKFIVVWSNENGNWGVCDVIFDTRDEALTWAERDAAKSGWTRVVRDDATSVYCYRGVDLWAQYDLVIALPPSRAKPSLVSFN